MDRDGSELTVLLFMNRTRRQLLYFLDFFPWVLLISVPARMWVQFKGGNKMRAWSISIISKVRVV